METSCAHYHRWNSLHTFFIHDERKYFLPLSSVLLYSFLSIVWCVRQSLSSQLDGLRYNASRTKHGTLDVCGIAGRADWSSAFGFVCLLWFGMAWNVRCACLFLGCLPARGTKIFAFRSGFLSALPIPKCCL